MKLKGYEVWISCNGKRLPEYNIKPEGDDGKTLACFVPSESGKVFAIEWQDHVKRSHLSFRTSMDGKFAGGNICRPGDKGKRLGVRVDPSTRRMFTFANLQTTDDEEKLGIPLHANVGEIKVGVERIRAEHETVQRTWDKFKLTGAVHERSKKAGVHCVSLGEARVESASTKMSASKPLHPGEGEIAKFIFRYRPLPLLQAQGIVTLDVKPNESIADADDPLFEVSQSSGAKRPRSDSEDGIEEGADVKPVVSAVDVDSDEDLEVLKSQLRQLQDTVDRAIKRRKSGAGLTAASVKAEPSSSHRRQASKADVIDLTLND